MKAQVDTTRALRVKENQAFICFFVFLWVVCVDDEGWFLGFGRREWKKNENGGVAATATVSPSFTGPTSESVPDDGLSVIATDIDTIMVAMPKLSGKGFIHVPFVLNEWKPTRCACCKVFGHIQEECPKNPGLGVAKNLKKPIEASRGGIQTWLEKLIIDGKVTLVDDDGKLLKKIDYPGDHDSDDKVYSVHNDMARSMATETVGFCTKSLLECYGIGIGLVKQGEEQYRQQKANYVKPYVLQVDLDPYGSPYVFMDSAV
nr:hypothetical protein [Tanacetum cinerariifolium]